MRYVKFDELSDADQRTVVAGWYHRTPWIPNEEFTYPVKKMELYKKCTRKGPNGQRAAQLRDLWEIKQTLES